MNELTKGIVPAEASAAPQWGSDVVAALLRSLGVAHIALAPGSSFRGLHDSVVNELGNERPDLVLCIHEEHAVAIAHGYYKASGRIMAVALHANVGLMHATMAIFNAWCDRVPVLLVGAAGPYDAPKRRPWVDWLHTSTDLGALVRGYTKWDDRPVSIEATVESLLRGHSVAMTAPRGPVYVCMDLSMQEERVTAPLALPSPALYASPQPGVPAPADVDRVAELLARAERPVLLVGRVSTEAQAWDARIRFAEMWNLPVLNDLKVGIRFPTSHPNHVCPPGMLLDADSIGLLRAADLVVSLDWVDLGGTLKHAFGPAGPVGVKVVQCSLDQYNHNGWSMDYQSLPAADVNLLADPDGLVQALVQRGGARPRAAPPQGKDWREAGPSPTGAEEPIGMEAFAATILETLADEAPCYARLPIGWPGARCVFDDPLDYLGYDGAGGIGSGPGMAVGAAMALKGGDRLPVAVLGDGDFLMGVTALWTAVNQRAPLLVVVANNHSFFNDELHQDRIARSRARPVENRGIGIRMDDPVLDMTHLARGQGAVGIGPVRSVDRLREALREGVAAVRGGAVVVVDAHVASEYARGIPQNVLQHEGAGEKKA